MWYLAIVVVATVVLYYELYIGGAVSPKILTGYGMTFPFYVYISVVATRSVRSARYWPASGTAGAGRTSPLMAWC